jgi:multidrug resistance efflux pump
VEEGQVIARLGSIAHVQAALTTARFELINAQQGLDHLYEDAELVTVQTQLVLANARDALDDAEYKWRVQQQGNRASDERIDETEANLVLAQNAVDRAKRAYDRLSGRAEDDSNRALALSNYAGARMQRDSVQRNLNWYTGHPSEIEQKILDAEVAEAEAALMTAEREYAKVEDGADQERVELAEARLENARAAVLAAEQTLTDMELRANFSGTISDVYIRNGEFVGPGQPIALLADLTELVIETTDLNEIDVALIAVGDPVTITFDALPEVGILGTLTFIASKANEGVGVNYPVEIHLDEAFPENVRWGMTAFVDIDLGD